MQSDSHAEVHNHPLSPWHTDAHLAPSLYLEEHLAPLCWSLMCFTAFLKGLLSALQLRHTNISTHTHSQLGIITHGNTLSLVFVLTLYRRFVCLSISLYHFLVTSSSTFSLVVSEPPWSVRRWASPQTMTSSPGWRSAAVDRIVQD